MEIEPITQATAQGLTSLIEYGVLGVVACIALGFSAIVAWVLIGQAKQCFEGTKKVVENNTETIRDSNEKTVQALHVISLILTRLEAKADAK